MGKREGEGVNQMIEREREWEREQEEEERNH